MISGSTIRYEKVRTTENYEEPDTEEDEVTVFISQTLSREHKVGWQRKGTWVRLSVALLLLLLAIGFVICEWRGCLCDERGPAGNSAIPGPSGKVQEQKGHSHHDDHPEDHDVNEEHHEHQHPNGLYHHGVVITDSAICSGIGRGVLEGGGNAVDAGIASLLCLGVVHPHATGVGGVFSAIFYNGTSGTQRAVRSISQETHLNGYGIPAVLQGLRQLHSLFGFCDWEKVLVGAVKVAKDGFHVDQALAAALRSNQDKILQSNLCDLYCDGKDTVKVLGSTVVNQKLSELLEFVRVNNSHIPGCLALKLAEDLPLAERQGFVDNVEGCRMEVNDPLIVEKEEYNVYAATSQLSHKIIWNVLEKVEQLNLESPWNNADLNSSASAYISLLTAAKEIYHDSLSKENRSIEDLLALNSVGSQVGVFDPLGNAVVISSSLNSPFGSKRLLTSTGVILSDVSPADNPLLWNCPLILKLKHDDGHHDDDHHHDGDDDHHHDGDDDHHHEDNNDDDDEEILAVGVTGGLSAPFLAAQIIASKFRSGKSAQDAVTGPLLRLDAGASRTLSGCVSMVTNGSDASQLLLEREGSLVGVASCLDSTLALILQAHAEHVGAYGAPAAGAHADGY